MRIVFMGTPDFATGILRHLIEHQLEVVAVVSVPDKPVGRGLKVGESSVKKYALSQNLSVFQPKNLKDSAFLAALKSLNADLFVVVAFRMLPEEVWSMPPLGTINLHASLLPNYRGAAPIHWAIINGEQQTGVTTFFIEKEIDTGQIIERNALSISENETVGELHDRLQQLGAQTTLSTIRKIESGRVEAIPQSKFLDSPLKVAPKIFRENCHVDFTQTVERVHNFVRGLSPHPSAWCILKHPTLGRKTYKLFASQKTNVSCKTDSPIQTTKEGILLPCSDAYLLITELQQEGKRRMTATEFLVGNSLHNWTVFMNESSF